VVGYIVTVLVLELTVMLAEEGMKEGKVSERQILEVRILGRCRMKRGSALEL
jgi:hypothetical protein